MLKFFVIQCLKKFLQIVFIIVSAVYFVVGCTNLKKDDKKDIIDYVNENKEDIVLSCEEVLEKRASEDDIDKVFEDIIDLEIISDIEVLTKGETVVFEGGAEGILTSTFTWGFFYSADDTVKHVVGWVSVNGEPETNEEETSWRWTSDGDDYYYVEKICDKFYYYNAGN